MSAETPSVVDLDNARRLLAQAVNRSESDIPDDAMIDNFDAWDSLAHMRLLTALEEKLGKRLPPTMVVSIRCLKDIDAVLASGTLPSDRMVSW